MTLEDAYKQAKHNADMGGEPWFVVPGKAGPAAADWSVQKRPLSRLGAIKVLPQAWADAQRLYAELPEDLAGRTLYPWMDARGLDAAPRYREQFRAGAIVLRMVAAQKRGAKPYVHMTPSKPYGRNR